MLFTRVLVPVDFSPPSVEALRLAVDVGLRTGARLTLLCVDNAPVPGSEEDSIADLKRLAAIEIPTSIIYDVIVDSGPPAERINHHARDGDHDLVVMGTHGKTGLERIVLGSVAEQVVRTCPSPVLVTHHRAPD